MNKEINYIFSINPINSLQIQEFEVGRHRWPYVIIDNIYQNPHKVREHVLSLEFLPTQSRHPGMFAQLQSDIDFRPLLEVIHKFYTCKFNYSFQETVQNMRNVSKALFACMNRGEESLDKFQGKPHVDNCYMAGLIYLNPEDCCLGGTGFYQHVETGVETLVMRHNATSVHDKKILKNITEKGAFQHYNQTVKEKGLTISYDEYIESVIQTEHIKSYMTKSTESWLLIDKVDMKFNRLVLYPGFVLHSAYYKPEWFGTSLEKQRLTQNIFIK